MARHSRDCMQSAIRGASPHRRMLQPRRCGAGSALQSARPSSCVAWGLGAPDRGWFPAFIVCTKSAQQVGTGPLSVCLRQLNVRKLPFRFRPGTAGLLAAQRSRCTVATPGPKAATPELRLNGGKEFAGQCRFPTSPFDFTNASPTSQAQTRGQTMRTMVLVKATEDSKETPAVEIS